MALGPLPQAGRADGRPIRAAVVTVRSRPPTVTATGTGGYLAGE